jgi:hypothetical protein
MRHKIYPAARRRIIEIWQYTDKTWGEEKADNYVRSLYKRIWTNNDLWLPIIIFRCQISQFSFRIRQMLNFQTENTISKMREAMNR